MVSLGSVQRMGLAEVGLNQAHLQRNTNFDFFHLNLRIRDSGPEAWPSWQRSAESGCDWPHQQSPASPPAPWDR